MKNATWPQNPHGLSWRLMTFLSCRGYWESMACMSLQTVLCYLCSGKAGASDSVKVGTLSNPSLIMDWTWEEMMSYNRWIPRHYIKISTLVHDFYISKRINIRILLVHDLQHTRLSQFNFGKFYLSQCSWYLWVLRTHLHPNFLCHITPLSNSLSVGFGLKSLFYQPWEWKNHSIIFLWLQIQG